MATAHDIVYSMRASYITLRRPSWEIELGLTSAGESGFVVVPIIFFAAIHRPCVGRSPSQDGSQVTAFPSMKRGNCVAWRCHPVIRVSLRPRQLVQTSLEYPV